jgi:multicomponent Na+:H+ antiporter subunit F
VSVFLLVAALALLFMVLVGLVQPLRLPTRPESLLAALLFGSTGTALVLLLGKGLGLARGLDAAPGFALLAAVLGVAFVLRALPDQTDGEP